MSKPLVVVIPHHIGRQEAKSRLDKGLSTLRTAFGDKLGSIEHQWTEDRLDVRLQVLGQAVGGRCDVADDQVRVEVELPWLLAVMAEKARGLIQKEGTLLLEKKSGPV